MSGSEKVCFSLYYSTCANEGRRMFDLIFLTCSSVRIYARIIEILEFLLLSNQIREFQKLIATMPQYHFNILFQSLVSDLYF